MKWKAIRALLSALLSGPSCVLRAALPPFNLSGVMVYRGTVKDNIIVLEPGVKLMDGTVVKVQVAETEKAGASPNLRDPFSMADLAVETGITDLATNVDHYLYGHPKASHGG